MTSQGSMGVHGGSGPLLTITESKDKVGSISHHHLSMGRQGGLWVCPSPCVSLCLQRMRSFCICQTDASGRRAAGTQHRGPAEGCRELPAAAQEMPPAVNISNVINEPSVHPPASGEQGGGSAGAGEAVGSSLASPVECPSALLGFWVLPTECLSLPQPTAPRPHGAGVADRARGGSGHPAG